MFSSKLLIYVFLIIIIIGCSSSIGASTKVPDILQAPVLLTENQYKEIKRKAEIDMTNIPHDVEKLHIWTAGEDQKNLIEEDMYHINSDARSRKLSMPNLTLNERVKIMFINLIMKNQTCGPKPIIIIVTAEEQTHLTEKMGSDIITLWTNSCLKLVCTIHIDWENICDNNEMSRGIFTTLKETASKLVTKAKETFGFTKDKKPVIDNMSTNAPSDKNIIEIGYKTTFFCKTNDKSIIWEQLNHDGTIILSLPEVPTSDYSLFFTLEAFDNNTFVRCKLTNPKTQTNKQTIKPQEIKITGNITPKLPNIYYNRNKKTLSPDFVCDETSPPYFKSFIALIRNNKIKIIENVDDLTEADNGSTISCLNFVRNEVLHTITRLVKNKYMLIYEDEETTTLMSTMSYDVTTDPEFNPGPNDQEEKAFTDHIKDNGDINIYYIGGASIVGIMLLLIILLIIIKKRYCNKSTLTRISKEDKITNSKQILYADLDLSSASQNGRRPAVEESAYAEITNPHTVKYAQLYANVQECATSLQTEETPYAQIIHTDGTTK